MVRKKSRVKIPKKVLEWREKLRRGTIMRPATFRKIKRKAAAKYRKKGVGKKVSGKAYYVTLLRKYLDRHPRDTSVKRTLRELLKPRSRGNPMARIIAGGVPGVTKKNPKATLKKWDQLTSSQKSEIQSAFVHWHYDKTSPTFEDWAKKHAFYITKRGRLAVVPKYAEPHYLAKNRKRDFMNPRGRSKKYYVGLKMLDGRVTGGQIIQSARAPTEASHGRFDRMVGPFTSKLEAQVWWRKQD